MASSTSQSQYVYVIIRLKMYETINGIAGSLFCHYGETDDAFLIGGLIDHDETLTAGVVRHCKRLVGFSPGPSQRFYLAKVINGLLTMNRLKFPFLPWTFSTRTCIGGLGTIPLGWRL